MSAWTAETAAEQDDIACVRWAQPVRPDKVGRLYQTDARGITDEALIDDVGCALFLRCRSICAVTDAVRGRVACPRCACVIVRARTGNSALSRAERLRCAGCGWHATWERYRQTFHGQQMYGAGGMEAFETFLMRFEQARTAREKLFAIDRLIHSFHYNLSAGAKTPAPSRPAAANLLEGSLAEVVGFLDRLSHGDAATPEMRATRAAYESLLPNTWAGKQYRAAE